jgi:hypothetical protein
MVGRLGRAGRGRVLLYLPICTYDYITRGAALQRGPRLRTGESLELVSAPPSSTSLARREHSLWASGVRWWVRTVRLCTQGSLCMLCQTPPLLTSFDMTLSPQWRITAASLCTAFAHIPGEAGTLALGICSVVLGRKRHILPCYMYICT